MSTVTPQCFIPRGYSRLRMPGGRSLLLHRRTLLVTAVVCLTILAVGVYTLATGAYEITSASALRTLILGEGSDLDRFIVLDQRLPRVIAAFLVGSCLGAAGAIFQSVSRNPLGSPDIIGFTTGAATGGLVVILVGGSSTTLGIGVGTIIGGAMTAVAVVLISLRGGLGGDRLVLSGIAIAAMLGSVNDYLLSRSDIEDAEVAKAWQHGSLNAISWSPLIPLVVVVVIAIPAALAQARQLRTLELGDDAAAGVGLSRDRTRVLALVTGVALTAIAVATAGPIGFLALAAPQLARRLSGAAGVSILAATTVGGLLLVVADLAAQRVLSPFQIPVGLVTAAIGGAYLVWLLLFSRAARG